MTDLGQKIRAIRTARKMNQTEFAERLGVTQSTVTRWENGSVPGGKYLHEIAAMAGTTVDGLLDMGAKSFDIPVVGYVGAGSQIVPFDDVTESEGFASVERPPFVRGSAVAVEVKGDSLFPVAENGWRLVYAGDQTLNETDVLNRLCVVKLRDETTLVKRVIRGSKQGRYHLVSTNAPMIEDADLAWAAPVKAIIPA